MFVEVNQYVINSNFFFPYSIQLRTILGNLIHVAFTAPSYGRMRVGFVVSDLLEESRADAGRA